MYERKKITTERLTTAYYRSGNGNEKKLLLIHGNVTSSVYYLPLFPALEDEYDVVAPDLRCFGDSDALPVDARRGFGDWVDDLKELVDALGWSQFYMAGWSMGGCVTMAYAISHPEQLLGMTLINPGSPYGFGGTKGEDGILLQPEGLASGGGCANAQLIKAIEEGDREFARDSGLYAVNFTPSFRFDKEWEDLFVDELLKTKLGDGMYPGDSRTVEQWPYIAAGDYGICNTMAATHGRLDSLADINPKPPILWVRGESDQFVSDTSVGDFGFLGKCGFVPGWPGEEEFPPQPMVSQTRHVLEMYAANGGSCTEAVIPGGHGCLLESPDEFVAAVKKAMK